MATTSALTMADTKIGIVHTATAKEKALSHFDTRSLLMFIEERSDACVVCLEIIKPQENCKEVQPGAFVHTDETRDCYKRFLAGDF